MRVVLKRTFKGDVRSGVGRRMLLLVLVLWLSISQPLLAVDALSTLTGTVVDVQGRPASGAVLCAQWGAPKTGATALPLGPSATADAAGHFRVTSPNFMFGNGRITALVYNPTHTQGALVDMAVTHVVQPLTIRLQPVQAVHYQLRAPIPIGANEVTAHIWTQSGTVVGSVLGTGGTLMLPPGKYELHVSVSDIDSARQSFTVADGNVTLEPLKLALSPMAQHYGDGTPEVSALRDMDHQAFKIGSLRGRWTLLYFWADWCAPCVQEGMPKLMVFAKAHSASRNRFRIVAIHENSLHESGDWNDFHAKTLKLEREVWHGIPPFPLVYDETTRMTSDWGVHQFPTYALIDPDGNLVRGGDLSMLEAELDRH